MPLQHQGAEPFNHLRTPSAILKRDNTTENEASTTFCIAIKTVHLKSIDPCFPFSNGNRSKHNDTHAHIHTTFHVSVELPSILAATVLHTNA